MVAKRTARAQRTQTINQARALIITGPDDIRTRFTGQTPAELVAEMAALRPRPGSMVRYHTPSRRLVLDSTDTRAASSHSSSADRVSQLVSHRPDSSSGIRR